MMATVWITYSWLDNQSGDIDFLAQELRDAGLIVKLDRWTITAGKRLWEQIENFIQNKDSSDAWLMYATQNSLGSEPCKEEYAYALDRALNSRGDKFPIIALFPASVDNALIPAGIRTRLYVSLQDSEWKERIVASVEGRSLSFEHKRIEPFDLQVRHDQGENHNYVIEVRPRAGSWCPFCAAIPLKEKEEVSMHIMHGPRGRVTPSGVLIGSGQGVSNDGNYWVAKAANEATPSQSYGIFVKKLPSVLLFGVEGGDPQYSVEFDPSFYLKTK
ncbi:toll/interleukin-1 receptor domain-containing protein [Paenibacillus sp. 79R4]|uniref:toll/interleukin-1 receptor domain-containing protein n=1 Tax=Paenibacillus sp. 79R4 TaxID=2212847 RepID=UPI0015BD202C|nr:toll/interleukin-1 receptor domain-containing protein [Paenibacillus sp. 79R4]